MSNIEEMAGEYADKHRNSFGTKSTERIEGFAAGANAVLEEIEFIIEPIIESTDEGILDEDDRYYDENITAIYNKIKELKGE